MPPLLVPVVDDALCLALAARDGLGLDDADVNGDLQVALELGVQAVLEILELADLVEREVRHGLDLQLDAIKRTVVGQNDLILRGDLGEPCDDLLDLGREHVDAANDHHVVSTADDAVDLAVGATAAALLRDDARDIARAVAHERTAFTGEGREDELAVGAVGHGLERLGIDDLRIEMILGDMQAVGGGAFHRNAGTHDLGEAIDVAVLDAELVSNLLAHVLAGGLRAQDHAGDLELLGGIVSHLDSSVGDEQRVGGRARKDVSPQIAHHLDLALGVARRRGDDGAADRLAARMGAQAAGEQAVAVGHLDHGFTAAANHVDAAREALTPVLKVVRGVADHRRLAGGARRRVDARDIGGRDGEQAVRIAVAHVLLGEEGELHEVVEGLEVARNDARLLEALAIQRDVLVRMGDGALHAVKLQLAQLLDRHGLDVWLEVH